MLIKQIINFTGKTIIIVNLRELKKKGYIKDYEHLPIVLSTIKHSFNDVIVIPKTNCYIIKQSSIVGEIEDYIFDISHKSEELPIIKYTCSTFYHCYNNDKYIFKTKLTEDDLPKYDPNKIYICNSFIKSFLNENNIKRNDFYLLSGYIPLFNRKTKKIMEEKLNMKLDYDDIRIGYGLRSCNNDDVDIE